MAQVSQSLWQFIPIDQYSRPADPTTEVVRKGIRGVWDRFLERSRYDEKSVMAQDDLHHLSRELLETVAPSPAWDSAVSVMTDALTDWLKSPGPTLQVLVGPPFCGLSEIASHWAYANEWRVLTPPQPAEVLRGADEWFAELERNDDTPLVIPSLECYYLSLVRHNSLASRNDPPWTLPLRDWKMRFPSPYIFNPLSGYLVGQRAIENTCAVEVLMGVSDLTDSCGFNRSRWS